MEEQIISELINFVKEASPELWRIAVRQSFVSAAQQGLACVGLLVAAIYSIIMNRRMLRNKDEDRYHSTDYYAGAVVFGVLAFIFLFFFIMILGEVVGYVLNPEYYAIKSLTDLVGLGG